MNIAVGCPVTNRTWILPTWFEYTNKAFETVGIEPFYMFVCGTSTDSTPYTIQKHMTNGIIEFVEESAQSGKSHQWCVDRYHHMVKIRNRVLSLARETEPDYFLSLDSDILLHPEALSSLLEAADAPDRAAIGGKCYLTPRGDIAPNYAYLHGYPGGAHTLYRPEVKDRIFRVDVIMAIKLMTRDAYHVDYEVDQQGEDIGWSLGCRRQGLDLWYDSRICSKHVMEQSQLHEVDPRCGY